MTESKERFDHFGWIYMGVLCAALTFGLNKIGWTREPAITFILLW
jgi:hypothetical protein